MTDTDALAFFDANYLGKKGTKSSEERLRKIIHNAPEVMVKVTGFTYNFNHVKTHLAYISRNATIPLEDEQGHIYANSDDVKYLVDYWQSHHWDSKTHADKTRHSVHLVLSMPYGTDSHSVKDAVRSFASKTFLDYRYVMALHEDTDNPHVHLSVQTCGLKGNRLQIRRGDPQQWRQTFASELDKRGIDAEATPRAIRGVILKPITQALKHIKNRGIKLYTASGMIENIRNLWSQDKHAVQPRPWETHIKAKQKAIRASWLSIADQTASSDRLFSDEIKSFVEKMPSILTKRERINLQIFASVSNQENAQKLLTDHPELKEDIDKILAAYPYANTKYSDPQMQETFINKVIADIAHKRINGQSVQKNILIKENNDMYQSIDKIKNKNKEQDYEI